MNNPLNRAPPVNTPDRIGGHREDASWLAEADDRKELNKEEYAGLRAETRLFMGSGPSNQQKAQYFGALNKLAKLRKGCPRFEVPKSHDELLALYEDTPEAEALLDKRFPSKREDFSRNGGVALRAWKRAMAWHNATNFSLTAKTPQGLAEIARTNDEGLLPNYLHVMRDWADDGDNWIKLDADGNLDMVHTSPGALERARAVVEMQAGRIGRKGVSPLARREAALKKVRSDPKRPFDISDKFSWKTMQSVLEFNAEPKVPSTGDDVEWEFSRF